MSCATQALGAAAPLLPTLLELLAEKLLRRSPVRARHAPAINVTDFLWSNRIRVLLPFPPPPIIFLSPFLFLSL